MADVTATRIGQLEATDAADVPFAMDEDAFRAFYERTAASLLAYLSRISGDRQTADDLLQEAYYRLLRCREVFESDAHRRNYLYRIATNLVRDARRSPLSRLIDRDVDVGGLGSRSASEEHRTDVQQALGRLKPRERALLWLAYAQGRSHGEIASVFGLKTSSIKQLLLRARRKMAALLRESAPRGEQS